MIQMSRAGRLIAALTALVLFGRTFLSAQTRTNVLQPVVDPRGGAELVVCSQNLKDFGSYRDSKVRDKTLTVARFQKKLEALAQRFERASCDAIALQEILGRDELTASEGLVLLIDELKRRTNRVFDYRIGASNDALIRNGFLVAKERAEIVNYVSYSNVELPKLMDQQKPRFFPRGPVEIQIEVKPSGESPAKTVTLVNFHFKSRAGAQGDAAGLEWETYRMEMSEAIRRIVENRHSQNFASGESLLLVLGDRNSNFDTATAKILEGVLTLKHFQTNGPCRLSKRGVPLCQGHSALQQKLFSVLTMDPRIRTTPGTFQMKGVYSWLDDILMPAESLRFALRDPYVESQYDAGTIFDPKEASDHALVYVRLNW